MHKPLKSSFDFLPKHATYGVLTDIFQTHHVHHVPLRFYLQTFNDSCAFRINFLRFVKILLENFLLKLTLLFSSWLSQDFIISIYCHSFQVKAGNIVIALRKAEDGQTWGGLTEAQRKDKEAK